MKKILWFCLLVFGLMLSWTLVYAADFYVIPVQKRDPNLLPENIKCGKTIFGVAGTAGACVARTGQSACYDNLGTRIDCYGTGQDAEYREGCHPAVTPSGSSNFGNYKRTSFPCSAGFTDNLDGTVTDDLTGLVWLKNANCDGGIMRWADALTWCNALSSGDCGLSDGSVAGDWRLPNINELRSLFDPSLSAPCLPEGHPFTDVQSWYWSSTTYVSVPANAWYVYLAIGSVIYDNKEYKLFVWPVRSEEPCIAVTVNPLSVSLGQGQSQQFTATVTNASDPSVTWSLSPAVGSISAAGLYTAPASITSQQTVTITATSVEDPTKKATATVSLEPPSIAVTVNTLSVSLGQGQSRQFTATVTNASDSSASAP